MRIKGKVMPTYEYLCDGCGHEFEQFQSITARPLKKCPACGARKLRRLIGAGGGVLFRGTGFYQTDYRSEAYQKAAKAEKAAQGGSETGGADAKSTTDTPEKSGQKAATAKEPGSGQTPPTRKAG
jgi:putative FmdB family regulatory protein